MIRESGRRGDRRAIFTHRKLRFLQNDAKRGKNVSNAKRVRSGQDQRKRALFPKTVIDDNEKQGTSPEIAQPSKADFSRLGSSLRSRQKRYELKLQEKLV